MLDREWIVATLRASYWGGWLTEPQINQAIDASLCFGLYTRGIAPLQIGFARAVTDGATFSSVMDVIIREGWRRQGFGTALMEEVVRHPLVAPTICVLDTRNAHRFYAKLGFLWAGHVMKRDAGSHRGIVRPSHVQ